MYNVYLQFNIYILGAIPSILQRTYVIVKVNLAKYQLKDINYTGLAIKQLKQYFVLS